MTNKSKLIGIAFSLAAVIIVFTLTNQESNVAPPNDITSNESSNSSSEPAPSNESKTIATEWQWSEENKGLANKANTTIQEINQTIAKASESPEALPFTEKSVRDALQEVKIDEYGHIILDNTALLSLDEALERIYKQLDPNRLEQLQELIKAGLPGLAGEQTAELVGNYTNFLSAKDEFSQLYENKDQAALQTVETLQADEDLYQELQSLRESYLGKETTDQLFAITDANAQYMFDTLKLGADESLTPEERNQRLQEVQERHATATIDIPNWVDRYDSFLSAKETILNASISDDEKQNQLSALLQERFNEQEQGTIEHLALDVL